MKHTENDFAIPALKALYSLGGKAKMSEIKDKIPEFIELSNEDKVPFASRTSRKEARYRQVVGNLTCHHNDTFFKYAVRNNDNTLELTREGYSFIAALIAEEKTYENRADNSFHSEQVVFEDQIITDISHNAVGELLVETSVGNNTEDTIEEIMDDILIDKTEYPNLSNEIAQIDAIDKKNIDYATANGLGRRPNGDAKIRDSVIDICQRKCQYATFIGAKHKTFNGSDGKPYVECHHLIPLSARKDFFPKNLDRPSNMVCLCPTCHNVLHHGARADKMKILRVLYDKYIDNLNDEQIYITFEQLINKYYGGNQ